MKVRLTAAALAAATLALAVPAALPAQVEMRVERRVAAGSGAWLGILFDWDEDTPAEALVREVLDESPAARAGLREGDVVVQVNGRPATGEAVDEMREGLKEGDQVRLRVRRDGRDEEKVVTAAHRPERTAMFGRDGVRVFPGGEGARTFTFRVDSLGVHVDSLMHRMDSLRVELRGHGDVLRIHGDSNIIVLRDSMLRSMGREPRIFRRGDMPPIDELRRLEGLMPFSMEFGPRAIAGAEFTEMNRDLGRYFRTDKGLLVLQVAPSTPAARAGLEGGDVVVKANGDAVETVADLRRAFSRGEDGRVKLEVLRQGGRREIDVRWEGPELFGRPGERVRVYRREGRGT